MGNGQYSPSPWVRASAGTQDQVWYTEAQVTRTPLDGPVVPDV